jgi:hypothetical protein
MSRMPSRTIGACRPTTELGNCSCSRVGDSRGGIASSGSDGRIRGVKPSGSARTAEMPLRVELLGTLTLVWQFMEKLDRARLDLSVSLRWVVEIPDVEFALVVVGIRPQVGPREVVRNPLLKV